ncbi:DUF551 domain-containing protein [Enterobacter hormaechei]|uniref:DUF551 domain-containing protein n=1 Tax=Enterobacter hormaechei TaxID=158836 RepID=UPI001AEEA106|nr:DUF551 domain-containing protein [Enterobacter hormaechei]
MSTLTKKWLQQTIAELEEERDATPGAVNEDAAMALAAMKLALAMLEAEAVAVTDDMAYAFHHALSDSSLGADDVEEIKAALRAAFANVTAPPAPASVPAAMEMDDDFDSAFEHGKAVGWNAYRAAMLQGAAGNSPVIPDGWVACSERLPPEGYEPDGGAVCYLVWHKNEVDCGPQYSISNVFFLRKHWERNFTHWMPLPAAPQQEVK